MKYPLMMALLAMTSESQPLTDSQTAAAEAKLGDLYKSEADAKLEVTTLTGQLETVKADLLTAQGDVKTKTDALAKVTQTATTLQAWKDEQAVVDGREEDASNGGDNTRPRAAFESASDDVVARVKARLGVK